MIGFKALKSNENVCSDRFLPDKAIDLIDEAGSRVRLRHAQVRIAMGNHSGLTCSYSHTLDCIFL